jgi:hypothetical protein
MKVNTRYLVAGGTITVVCALSYLWHVKSDNQVESTLEKVERQAEPANAHAADRVLAQVAPQAVEAVSERAPAVLDEPEDSAQRADRPPLRDPDKPFIPDPMTLQDRLERARERQELATRWENERQDAAFARESEVRMAEILLERGLEPKALKELDCRETVCRFRLDAVTDLHKEVGELAKAARSLAPETWLLPEEVPDDPARKYTIEVFFARPGYRLSGGGGRIGDPPRMAEAAHAEELEALASE